MHPQLKAILNKISTMKQMFANHAPTANEIIDRGWIETCIVLTDRITYLQAVVSSQQDANHSLTKLVNHNQYRIDELMLEYCANEMTQDQLDNWIKRQAPINCTECQGVNNNHSAICSHTKWSKS